MADDPLVAIAKEVASELQAGSFAQAIDVRRAYRPVYNLKKDRDLKVTVVIGDYEETPLTRGLNQLDVQIDVGLQKKLATDDPEEVDPLLSLVREIRTFLRRPLPSTGASFIGLVPSPLYSGEHLITHRLFTSVSTFTYRTKVVTP